MCSKTCAKWCLVLFNFIFFLFGLITLGVGIFVLADTPAFVDTLTKVEDITGQGVQNETLDIPALLKSSAYALIIAGASIFLIGFFGCCGALKEIRFFLVLYAILVSIILIVELSAGIMCATLGHRVQGVLETYLVKTIKEEYVGLTTDANGKMKLDSKPIGLAWDSAQIALQCCGAKDYKDYQQATKWSQSYTVPVSGGGTKTIATPVVPITCCAVLDPSVFPEKMNELEFVDVEECLTNPKDINTNLNGCSPTVEGLLFKYMKTMAIIGLCIGLVEILGVIFACYLCKAIGNYKEIA